MPSQPTTYQPQRSCVACRRKRPQSELLRITGSMKYGWRVTGLGQRKREGRGKYVCADTPQCWQSRQLGRAFRGQAAQVAKTLVAYAEAKTTKLEATAKPTKKTPKHSLTSTEVINTSQVNL